MEKRNLHVFIVDDFKDNREMYAYFLSESGFRVTPAADGNEALQKAAQLQPDLIVMDLSLPGMDGLEAARLLKTGESTKHIPIVILTAYDLVGAIPEGCDGFLTKPCLPDRMISEITRVLDRHRPRHASPSASDTRAADNTPRPGLVG
ncbi:MAG TPA: response regulator [Terriglobia bacterium]|jgi:two-component system cell cycle response regulator DivK|nr:response regulator [Terriglobia bacterium]